ncbi:hypothetical protein FACS1894161_2600 [Spirochaetia bacterium]|nr:hypothetical protein FACS1894161_2600 [Spirochaetia bacterium]
MLYKKILRFFLLSAFFLVAMASVYAEDHEDIVYYIKNIDVAVEGRTQPSAILRAAGFVIGEEIHGDEALAGYIERKRQTLLNNRALAEVTITHTIAEENGRYGITLAVSVVDTRNFVILPEPKYSSNAGFEPSLKLRDYNFLGTLMPLKIDFGYSLDDFHLDDSSKGKYALSAETELPFRALELDWKVKLALALAYVADEPLAFENITGISVDLPFKNTVFTLGFDEGVVIREEYFLFEKKNHEIFEDISYMYSRPFACWRIPLPLSVPQGGELFFTSELSSKINYRLSGNDLGWRQGPVLAFGNEIGVNNINWVEKTNFRSGYAAVLAASNEYNTYFNEWNNSVSVLGIAHKQFTSFFAASARFRYKTWFNDTEHYHDQDRVEAGNMLRGILDRSINADQMLSFNFDFPFSVFKFMPSTWAHKESLRYFDFEFQISPVIDMAFVKGAMLDSDGVSLKELKFNFDDFLVTGGIEVLVFPFAWRSIFLRGSIAWNLRETVSAGKLPSGINREIHIGLGHHF